MLNDNVLQGLLSERLAILRHLLLVRIEPPPADDGQSEEDDQDSNDLSG
jgi:hypothetical protein